MADDTMVVESLLPTKPDGGSQVALWEVDPAHPVNDAGVHEVFVAGPGKHEVGRTAAVMGAIRDGKIREVRGGAKASSAEEPKDLGRMKKDELLAHARSQGVECSEDMTKGQILDALEAAGK